MVILPAGRRYLLHRRYHPPRSAAGQDQEGRNISNSYIILKEIEKTNIKNIVFVIRLTQADENLDYIINRIFRDLIPLDYNLDIKYIKNYKDFFDEDFNVAYTLKRVA